MEHSVWILSLTADVASGGAAAPWWLRWGLLVAGALALAALMVLVQTRHRPPRGALWALVILGVPILGPTTYFIVETVRHRREYPSSSGEPPRR
ncbi:PLDc N-terminal domain-containing protein [Nesterenkonia xinjiangensis]|uniref:Cardiolipin synthase N-terminal domain-containing protein n=1 Tax=Nesterenkonia xinjiangensis TaxID=225327 RepID=A0A7Z0GLZ8_9MICC|nr:PLDc N-terminal domain-containing protein [Nesterenkonia xinjiangensis]NYJ77964.1 hypothetical protein [Nesterenkonia xinjiangensis]